MALTLYLSLDLSVSETIEIDTVVNIDVDRKKCSTWNDVMLQQERRERARLAANHFAYRRDAES